MAAGLGYIEFATGDILTAAAANGYLASQTVMVFADAAARTAAITSPQEGMFSYLKDSNSTQYYSGSAWVSIGGASPLTTKGDLYTYSTTDARLAVGTNGQTLVADSTAATGLKWAAPTSGLTLITKQSYSTASSVNVNDVFSASYENYLVIVKNSAASAASAFNMRLRVSGADNTTSNYSTALTEANNSATVNRYNTGQTSFFSNTIDQSSVFAMVATFVNPFASTSTSVHFSNSVVISGFRSQTGAGLFDDTASFTGFSLLPQSGATMTGVVAVYGYAIA
jgi:hypothetical protein